MFCPRYKRETLATFLRGSACCVCESSVRSERWLPSHILRIIKKEISLRIDDRFNCYNKSLKIRKRKCLYLLENPRKNESVVSELSLGLVISCLHEVAIGCQWSKSLLYKLRFFHNGFSFTLRIAKLNLPQVLYRFCFPGSSYFCVLYIPHFILI